ncbi:MAG TPA: DUF177 domain-containing protein [Oscillospiraceae bacterium]|nr:DUF177 domain-containing protein [Oscillospiraceae bacterium]
MTINLESVFSSEGLSVPIDYTMDLSSLSHSETNPLSTPVKIFGSIKNTAGVVNLSAKISFEYKAFCDRCTRDVSKEYEILIDYIITHTPVNDESKADEYIFTEDMQLQLDEIVLENIVLNLPIKFLCDEDCKGLCPMCGHDLNTSQCNCKKPIDPRLLGLLQFLE